MKNIILSIIGIALCAVPAAISAWIFWKGLGLEGVLLAIVSALTAMVLATFCFALLAWVVGKFSRPPST